MRFIEVVICAGLISFLGGLFWATQAPESVDRTLTTIKHYKTVELIGVVRSIPFNQPTKIDVDHYLTGKEPLKPCSEATTMPCDGSPLDPLRESLNAKDSGISNYKLFVKGEKVTCIYPLIKYRAWSDGTKEEYAENTGLKCNVLQASESFDDIEKNYQHIQVDCTKDMANTNAVIGHKLNSVRWTNSVDCYHFVQ